MVQKGFTLVELLVTIAIIAVLSAIILFSIGQYINKSKDASIQGNLSSLVPAGEVYYDHNGIYGYSDANSGEGFCASNVVVNADSSIPVTSVGKGCRINNKDSSICCKATRNAWAACAQEFVNKDKAFCVDSRGYKREIDNSDCDGAETACPLN